MNLNPFILGPNDDNFPAPSSLGNEGPSVIGANLQPETILKAYRKGYFPWHNEGQTGVWYHPNPRMVLLPENIVISKSMRPYINGSRFLFKINKHFPKVIKACGSVTRWDGQTGSWISDEIIESYTRLHEMGYAHCGEAWQGNKLVGGLYGIRIGEVFFGESMFSTESNASKFAFILLARWLVKDGVKMIDCQQESRYMASLGARPISRQKFIGYLEEFIPDNENIW